MLLSLSLIKERLGTTVKESNLGENSSTLHLPRPVFYSGDTCLNSNTLYISTAENMPQSICFDEGAALICISVPPASYFNDVIDLLIVDDAIDVLDLSNKIHAIYDFYDAWDLKLRKRIREHKSLQDILDITEPVFENALSAMNSDYYLVARTSLSSSIDENEEIGVDDFGRLNMNQVNSFKNNSTYQEIQSEKNTFIYQENLFPYKTLCKNIFHNEQLIYRIVVIENMRTFKDSDEQLLDYLVDNLLEDPAYFTAINQIENVRFVSLLQDMILGNAYSELAFHEEIKRIGWQQSENYCIAHILPSNQDIYNSTLTYFCNKLMYDFKHTFAFTKDDHILVIINASRIQEARKNFFQKFNSFIRSNGFKIGYSNDTEGMHRLKEYFKEAEIALVTGMKYDPITSIHKFSDYVLAYMLDKVTEDLPGEYVCSPVIARLVNYDRDNNTEYLKTFNTYLKNNMNALQTAKDLHIHRATIVYRLERIKEIGQMDFKNSDQLLHVYLSLRISYPHIEVT